MVKFGLKWKKRCPKTESVNVDATDAFRGQSVGEKWSLFCQLREDISDPYTSAADTYLPACNLVCCTCRCRTCSTTISRLISAADIVSYLRQNSRLLDDNGGLVVGSQFCSVAKMYGSNRIRQSGLPLT